MNVNNLLDLSTDYLFVNPIYSTATGLSSVKENNVRHDQVTCLLSGLITSHSLGQQFKKFFREIRYDAGLLIIEDHLEPKPYNKTKALIIWSHIRCIDKRVKGVNLVSSFYYRPKYDMWLSTGVDTVLKVEEATIIQRTTLDKSKSIKNEMMHDMVKHADYIVGFKYVLANSWFSSSTNMTFITEDYDSDFIMPIKSNRLATLSKGDREKGIFQSIESIELEGHSMSVYLKQYGKPIRIVKQVFRNGDCSTGRLYLATSDLNWDYQSLTAINEKRWKVAELFHSIINNTTFEKAPTKTVKTPREHFTASMIAFTEHERLKIRTSRKHYAMKSEIWLAATRVVRKQLDTLSTTNATLDKIAA